VHFPEAESQSELRLSELGLYVDIEDKTLAPDLIAYEPRYALWSDGAEKRRWLRLPKGTKIDNSDPDHWRFPVGTVLFKEFARAGKRLETRVIARVGEAAEATFMGTFLWRDDERDALLVRDGAPNVRETDHDLPSQKNCATCHNPEPGRVLGFSAVQQQELPSELLAQPQQAYAIPGTRESAQGLGYLHANCGHCHNPRGNPSNRTRLNLRLSVADVEAGQTTIERETVGVALDSFSATSLKLRVVAGDPDQSGIYARMSERGTEAAMPTLGTKHVDEIGMQSVRAWIAGLPH
jgi:mono/diheme cytochrome c family protein